MPFLALRPAPNVLDPWVTHKVSVDSPSKSATVSLKPAQDKAKKEAVLESAADPSQGSLSPGAHFKRHCGAN